jgi:RND superfamily putative drug exporter
MLLPNPICCRIPPKSSEAALNDPHHDEVEHSTSVSRARRRLVATDGILAALGAVTFVFQEGHLSGIVGIVKPGPILSFLPIILLGILFGLAMDYEVFLESRMREESLHKDPTTAVIDGYSGSAKVVASAAIIMVSVFGSFVLSPDPTTKSLGFALALGVLIDAFVIRMTVVPATMYIFKGAAWWLPRWMHRLPDLDIEGSSLAEKESPQPSVRPQ